MLLETTTYKGLIVKIHTDENPDNPRNESNLGKMYCFGERYKFGDDHDLKIENFDHDLDKVKEHLIEEGALVILPLYVYVHSGATMKTTPFNDTWDSGQVGWIVAFGKDIKENFGYVAPLSTSEVETVKNCLKVEVETYDQWLRGDVYGFHIIKPSKCKCCNQDTSETLESCWGFYGIDVVREEAMASAKYFSSKKGLK